MKIEDILKKQGELYKDLTSSETVEECNETIEPELVKYKNKWILRQEYKAIRELEKVLGAPEIADVIVQSNYEIKIQGKKIVYLIIRNMGLKEIPKSMNNLQNLRGLELYNNQISEIKNLDNLRNLRMLNLNENQITEIKGLDNLENLEELYLNRNQIKEINGLDNLTFLEKLFLNDNQITEIKGLDNLINLHRLDLRENPIKNKKRARNLRKKILIVYI